MKKPLLSNSGISVLTHTCPGAYKYEYIDHLHSSGFAPACSMGTAVHDGTQALRESGNCLVAATAAQKSIMDASFGQPAEVVERCSAYVAVMMAGYYRHMRIDEVRSVHNEVDIRLPMPETSLIYKCRVDGIILNPGSTMLYELKTTADTLDNKEDELRHGSQIALYTWAIESTYSCKINCAIADIIKKPLKAGSRTTGAKGCPPPKPAKGETWLTWQDKALEAYEDRPQAFFRRVTIPREEIDVEGSLESAIAAGKMLEHCLEHGFPRQRGDQCEGRYGPCRYKKLCWHGDDSKFQHKPYQFDGEKVG